MWKPILNPKGPDCRGFKRETVDEFLARGGHITKLPYHKPKNRFVVGYNSKDHRGIPWTEIVTLNQGAKKPSLDDYDNWSMFK